MPQPGFVGMRGLNRSNDGRHGLQSSTLPPLPSGRPRSDKIETLYINSCYLIICLTGRAQPQGHPALVASPSQEGRAAGDVPKPPAEAEGQQEQGAVPRRRPRRDQAPNLVERVGCSMGLVYIHTYHSDTDRKIEVECFEGSSPVLLKTSTRPSTWPEDLPVAGDFVRIVPK